MLLRDGSLYGVLEVSRIKAEHVRRYLSRVRKWGANRGYTDPTNPATGVDMPTERKLRRLPDAQVMANLIRSAYTRGQQVRSSKGGCAPYLWAVADLAYLCRLRAIEVVRLRASAAS